MALSVVDGTHHTCCSCVKDVTESQPSRHKSSLHRGCPKHFAKSETAMRSYEIVETPHQFEVASQWLMHTGMAQTATAQIPTTLPHRQV